MASELYDTDFLARLTVKRLAELNKTRAKVCADHPLVNPLAVRSLHLSSKHTVVCERKPCRVGCHVNAPNTM